MVSFTGFVTTIRRHPKKTLFGAAVLYWVSNKALFKWRLAKERDACCKAARQYGDQPYDHLKRVPRYHIILNRRAGEGDNVELFEKNVEPLLQLAAIDFDLSRTHNSEEVRTLAEETDFKDYTGIIVVGGDGTLQEVLSGMLQRPDAEEIRHKPIGLIPVGQANTFASQLMPFKENRPRESVAMRHTLGIIRGQTCVTDTLKVTWSDAHHPTFALGHVGWGLFGEMAYRGQERRWPGKARYEMAAYLSLLFHSVFESCSGKLEFKTADGEWHSVETTFSSLIGTSLPTHNFHDRYLDKARSRNDGFMTLAYTTSPPTGRVDLFKAVRAMHNGEAFVDLPNVVSHTITEMKLTPEMPPQPVPAQPTVVEPEQEPVEQHEQQSSSLATDASPLNVADSTVFDGEYDAQGEAPKDPGRQQKQQLVEEKEEQEDKEDKDKKEEPEPWSHKCMYTVDNSRYYSRPLHVQILPQYLTFFTPYVGDLALLKPEQVEEDTMFKSGPAPLNNLTEAYKGSMVANEDEY
eukprot:m.38365 g.38365  ORF g.38365 m.38365 type:complete len:519 (-) comp10192_c0_seq1:197-1753(-)